MLVSVVLSSSFPEAKAGDWCLGYDILTSLPWVWSLTEAILNISLIDEKQSATDPSSPQL
jgi:hypothetical protein